MPKICGVYTITNTTTGKFYVGSSIDVEGRWRGHRQKLALGKHHSRHLQRSWSKHGPESFRFSLVEAAPREVLIEREQAWIDSTGCFLSAIGYNIAKTAGASMQGLSHTAATRKKIGDLKRGRPGHPHTEESRRKIGDRHRGKAVSVETRQKLSLFNTGKTHTAEHCEAISRGCRGTIKSEATRQKMRKPKSAEARVNMAAGARARWQRAREAANV